jgi:hypothetical protein
VAAFFAWNLQANEKLSMAAVVHSDYAPPQLTGLIHWPQDGSITLAISAHIYMTKNSHDPYSRADNGGRRISIKDRRVYKYTEYIPERRRGIDRRSGEDRRKA